MSMTRKFGLHTLLFMNELLKLSEIWDIYKPNRDTERELPQVRED